MWQGDLCFGPVRDGQGTVQGLDRIPGWAGLPDLDEAGPRAIAAYFRTYGPATADHVRYWLGHGLSAGGRLRGWLRDVSERLVTVDVEGDEALVLAEDLDELAGTSPSPTVRLLPAADPWVMGPGTADAHVVPPARRPLVTRGANPVLSGGVVAGTWTSRKGVLTVSWFAEARAPDPDRLHGEAARLAAATGTELDLVLTTA